MHPCITIEVNKRSLRETGKLKCKCASMNHGKGIYSAKNFTIYSAKNKSCGPQIDTDKQIYPSNIKSTLGICYLFGRQSHKMENKKQDMVVSSSEE